MEEYTYGIQVEQYWQNKPNYSERSLPHWHSVNHKFRMEYPEINVLFNGTLYDVRLVKS